MGKVVKLSIIIPVYNENQRIKKCVESILLQSYKDYEIIIVDNNSTDDTYQVCMDLKVRYPLIRLFQTEKKGVSHARNLGLNNVRGQYIMFVDADDLLIENAINALMEIVEKSKSDIVQGRILHSADMNKKDCIKKMDRQDAGYMQKVALNPIRYEDKWISETVHGVWGKIYSKTAIKDVRFLPELVLGEDLFFYIQVLNNIDTVTIISDYVYLINSYNGESSTRRINKDMPKAPAIFKGKIEDFYNKNKYDVEFYENMNYQIFHHIEVGIIYQFKLHYFNYSFLQRKLFLERYLKGKCYGKYYEEGIKYNFKKNLKSLLCDYISLRLLQKEFFVTYCIYYGLQEGVKRLLRSRAKK